MTLIEPSLPNGRERITPRPTAIVRVLVAVHSEVVRRGLASMLWTLPRFADVTDHHNATAAARFAKAEPADILIASRDYSDQEFGSLKEAVAEIPVKIVLLLRDHDQDTLTQACSVATDGYLLESELTAASLGEALSRVMQGEVPMPAVLARKLLTRLQTQESKPAHRPYLLTAREMQALPLLVDGLSNRQIARRLGVSENGAKRHVANVLAKLNCSNRTLAVALVLREGLLDTMKQT